MAKPVLYNGDDTETPLPTKWHICPQCEGRGHSSGYLGAFTGEQMREDPEFAEDYMAGKYDRACDTCGGSGKVEVVDRKQLTKAQRRAWDAQEEADRQDRNTERMERLMEGGWREEGWYGE